MRTKPRPVFSLGVNEVSRMAPLLEGGPWAVELCGKYRESLDMFRLAVYSWHAVDYETGADLARASWKIFTELGVDRIVVHPRKGERAALETERLVREFLDHGPPDARLFIEIMEKPGYPGPGELAEILWGVAASRPDAKIGICLDFSHVLPPEGLLGVIERLCPLIGHAHVSDVVRKERGGYRRHALPGTGCIPWGEALTALRKVYKGRLVVEPHLAEKDPAKRWGQLRGAMDFVYSADPGV